MTKEQIDYFKGRKTEWSKFFKKYHKTPNEAEAEAEANRHIAKNVRYCEWYVTIDGDINFEDVKPLNKNGSVNWDHLNKQVSEFISDFKMRKGKKILIEITSRNTTDGLLDNHYVTGDKSAIEG